MSLYRVDLIWRTAVTYDSAARVISLAKEKQTSFADDVDEAAAAAPRGVADDARGAPNEVAVAALDEAVAPETKRRRVVANSLRCVTRPLPVWSREPTTQRLHQPLDPPSLITQEPHQPTTHSLQHSAVVRQGLRWQKLSRLHQAPSLCPAP